MTEDTYSLEGLPFSRYGAWFGLVTRDKEAIAQNIKEGSVFLRSYHFRNSTFMSLVPTIDRDACTFEASHDGALLTLSSGNGKVELCFESAFSLRIRGQGTGLRLDPLEGVSFPGGDAVVTLNAKKATRQYRIEALKGTLGSNGFWNAQEGNTVAQSIEVSPDDSGTFEIAIDEFKTTWREHERLDFDSCIHSARNDLETWTEKLPKGAVEYASTRRLAGYITWSCVVSPAGYVKRNAMFMSKNWMSNIWCWDNCFNAMAMVSGHPELAMDQLLAFVDHQDEFGSYPDVYNDVWMLFNYCKPPIHGWTLSEMLKRKPELPQEDLETMYASLSRWSEWWLTDRRRDGQVLPFYLHGNDSGWDNGTMFDGGGPLLSPDLAAFLVVQLEQLANFSELLGKEDAQKWLMHADAVQGAMMTQLWDGERFFGKHAITGQRIDSRSLLSYMPLILGKRLSHDVAMKLAAGVESSLTEWGPPTEPPDSPKYDPDGYWRGPIWAPSTYLIASGLQRCGYTDLAKDIARRFCKLCAKSGMAENFNAITGAPLRDPAYTWTASVFLLLSEYSGSADEQ